MPVIGAPSVEPCLVGPRLSFVETNQLKPSDAYVGSSRAKKSQQFSRSASHEASRPADQVLPNRTKRNDR
jgi:hypothetical protein